jgi:hypothetical protein
MTTYSEKIENYVFDETQKSLINIGYKPVFHKIIVPKKEIDLPNGLRPPPLVRNACLTVNIIIYVDENDIVIEDKLIDDIYINNYFMDDCVEDDSTKK